MCYVLSHFRDQRTRYVQLYGLFMFVNTTQMKARKTNALAHPWRWVCLIKMEGIHIYIYIYIYIYHPWQTNFFRAQGLKVECLSWAKVSQRGHKATDTELGVFRAQELCENWGGHPGLPASLIVCMVSVDVKQCWMMNLFSFFTFSLRM